MRTWRRVQCVRPPGAQHQRTLFYLGGAAAGGESGDSYFRIDAGPKVKIDRSLVSFDQAERRYLLAPNRQNKSDDRRKKVPSKIWCGSWENVKIWFMHIGAFNGGSIPPSKNLWRSFTFVSDLFIRVWENIVVRYCMSTDISFVIYQQRLIANRIMLHCSDFVAKNWFDLNSKTSTCVTALSISARPSHLCCGECHISARPKDYSPLRRSFKRKTWRARG